MIHKTENQDSKQKQISSIRRLYVESVIFRMTQSIIQLNEWFPTWGYDYDDEL